MIGQKVNNFEITALLGEGGMGAVYEARHPVIDRKVAIKVLRRELALNQAFVARFINEAKAATSIKHPNIIEVMDVGAFESGVPYLVMELLEGESLAARLRQQRRLPVDVALALVAQATSALGAAHAKGVVHRDLKPDNLFLLADPRFPGGLRLKVLDFGIAKLRPELAGESVRTHTGLVLGTPAYMSPEQCRGLVAEIDHRADIYALGVILYEMLCGAPPFVSAGQGDILIKHATEPPRPPRAIDPSIPIAVEQTILRALEKRPEARFQSMAELERALVTGAPAQTQTFPVQAPTSILPAFSSAAPAPAPSTTFSSTAGELRPVQVGGTARVRRGPGRALVIGAVLAGVAAIAIAAFGLRGDRPATVMTPEVVPPPAPAVATPTTSAPAVMPAADPSAPDPAPTTPDPAPAATASPTPVERKPGKKERAPAGKPRAKAPAKAADVTPSPAVTTPAQPADRPPAEPQPQPQPPPQSQPQPPPRRPLVF